MNRFYVEDSEHPDFDSNIVDREKEDMIAMVWAVEDAVRICEALNLLYILRNG